MFSTSTPRGIAASERQSDARLAHFTAHLLVNLRIEIVYLIEVTLLTFTFPTILGCIGLIL